MNVPSVRIIRIDGVVPQSKAAIAEALQHAPKNIMLIDNEQKGDSRIIDLTAIEPGGEVTFTDGAGKYYGKIKRTKTYDTQFIYSME